MSGLRKKAGSLTRKLRMNEKNTKKKTGKQAGHSSRTVMWKKETRTLTWMSMPAIVWYLLFCYLPMFGIFFAFKEFKPVPGDSLLKNLFVNSPWAGLRNFSFLLRSDRKSVV